MILLTFFSVSLALISNSSAWDVAQTGPGGRAIMYYLDKSRDEVVIVKCAGQYTKINSRKDCTAEGEVNRVSRAKFKAGIMSETELNLDLELHNLNAAGKPAEERLKMFRAKLEKDQKTLADLIAWAKSPSGCDPKCISDRKNLVGVIEDNRKYIPNLEAGSKKLMADKEAVEKGLKKIRDAVSELVDQKIASDDFHVVSSAVPDHRDQFSLLEQFTGFPECGTQQSIRKIPAAPEARRGIATEGLGMDARMKDCEKLPGSSKSYKNSKTGDTTIWKLVSRIKNRDSGRYIEVWQDSRPNWQGQMLLWTRLSGGKFMSHFDATKYCNSNEFLQSLGTELGKKFALPSEGDLSKAFEHGLEVIVKKRDEEEFREVEGEFWSSSGNLWSWVDEEKALYKAVGKDGVKEFASKAVITMWSYDEPFQRAVLCAGR